jgi:hypothetical protein
MKSRQISKEFLIYLLFFLIGLSIRFYQLGAGPLGEVEAGWALQALRLAHGEAASFGGQPAYVLLTSQLIAVFGDTNFIARFLPAMAGSLIVWLPYFFKNWMGDSSWLRRAGLIMAFGLALDPGLVSLSRQAGSLIPAMVFTLLALACLYRRHLAWTGIFVGLAMLSGSAFLQGLLILGISWGIFRLVKRSLHLAQPNQDAEEPAMGVISGKSIGVMLAAFGGTMLVIGTLFLQIPQGIGALAETIPDFVNSWIKPSEIPLLRLPASLLVYQPGIIIFGIIGAVHTWYGHKNDQRARLMVFGFCSWAIVALLLPLLYAGRQVGDMAWALIPLWALTAIGISRLSVSDQESAYSRLIAAGLGLLLFVLVVVGWINLLSIGRYQENVRIYWAIILGAFLLGLIAFLLVAAAWSTAAARLGMVWALCTVLGFWLLSNTWGMAIVRKNGAQDLWPIPTTTGQADLLNLTLTDLSRWNTGLENQLEVVILVDSPALRWELRRFPNAHFKSVLAAGESPPVVITSKDTELPGLVENYRGQDFIWWLYPGWQGIFPADFINWLAFRQAPLNQEQIILWARVDIFPGGAPESTGSTVP